MLRMRSVCSKWLVLLLIFFLLPLYVNAKVYLLAVGISDYPGDSHDLMYSVNDARALADVYVQNTEVRYCLLLDSCATRSGVIDNMKEILSDSQEDDVVVFFYSGHGYSDGFYVYDGGLKYEEIKLHFSECRSKTKIILADACKSGKFRTPKTQEAPSASSSTTVARNQNVMLFLSSRNDEYSIESSAMSGGYFTKYLIKGLQGPADKNKDGKVGAKELFVYVYTNVVKLSEGEQHPVMWGSFPDDMTVIKYK